MADMNLKSGHIEMFVKNPMKSRDFYRDILGFEEISVQNEYIWMKKDHIEILLRPGRKEINQNSYSETNIAFVLYTNNLKNTRNTLIGRGLSFRGFVDSEKCITFTDPDGNWFQLVDPEDH